MKLRNQLTLTASLLLVSGVTWGHAGHEALGDGVHIEYLLAAGVAAAVGLFALMRHKRGGQD
ncbi:MULTISPECIES: hypothetical protein [Marinobacter]|uniref:Uncharacterized protein n=1 Tax=Marinobacter profundi TaxID=2666256 RepID=A0A2G1UN30_9GAMM|nr:MULTISPECIES: hypothetical protein [Marinobacter]MBD3658651.1 hypothetical protein [Marinobacter sp.]PHQ15917.1 hypothetical protein CLH61_07200 [Marinobacter profundi]